MEDDNARIALSVTDIKEKLWLPDTFFRYIQLSVQKFGKKNLCEGFFKDIVKRHSNKTDPLHRSLDTFIQVAVSLRITGS